MPFGFYIIMAAQFFSALADNALLIVAISLLREMHAPSEYEPLLKTFFTVTLPGVKYGVVSACFVVFTLVVTDFGAPKAIGGKFSVMATECSKWAERLPSFVTAVQPSSSTQMLRKCLPSTFIFVELVPPPHRASSGVRHRALPVR